MAKRLTAADLPVDREGALRLLSRMVQHRSYSGEERPLAEFMAERMAGLGLEAELQEFGGGRCNVIGRWRGTGGGRSLMLNGHLDTNPAGEGWTRDPLAGDWDGQFIYGIGVSNMKAADAAFLAAVETLQRIGYRPRGDVILAYVVGELEGGIGTVHMLERGVRADSFVVGEPTDLSLLTLHAGLFEFQIETIGATRHISKREEAVDAIEKMFTVLNGLKKLRFFGASRRAYRGLNRLNVGVVRGGVSRELHEWRPALVADYCYAKGSGRLAPDQTVESALADIRQLVQGLQARDPELVCHVNEIRDHLKVLHPPFEAGPRSQVVQVIRRSHLEVTGRRPKVGDVAPYKFYGTDAGHLIKVAGTDGVVYGPGGKYNTMPDERVEIQDLLDAVRVYGLAITRLAA
jgi:acetylornithine deacetylase